MFVMDLFTLYDVYQVFDLNVNHCEHWTGGNEWVLNTEKFAELRKVFICYLSFQTSLSAILQI